MKQEDFNEVGNNLAQAVELSKQVAEKVWGKIVTDIPDDSVEDWQHQSGGFKLNTIAMRTYETILNSLIAGFRLENHFDELMKTNQKLTKINVDLDKRNSDFNKSLMNYLDELQSAVVKKHWWQKK